MGPSRLYRNPSQNAKIPRWTGGSGPPGDQQSMIPGPKFGKKSEKSIKFMFGEKWALGKSCKNHFPMVRGVLFLRSVNYFFRAILAPLKIT